MKAKVMRLVSGVALGHLQRGRPVVGDADLGLLELQQERQAFDRIHAIVNNKHSHGPPCRREGPNNPLDVLRPCCIRRRGRYRGEIFGGTAS